MSKENILVLPVDEGAELIQYQLAMLGYNPQPGIIPFQTKLFNQEIVLQYQLDSRQSLSEYLQRGTASGNIAELLLRIMDILQNSKKILLDPASFRLEPSYIYLEQHSEEIALVYQPFKTALTLQESLLDLQRKLRLIPAWPASADLDFQQIAAYLEQDYTSLTDFKRFLAQLSLRGPTPLKRIENKPFRLNIPRNQLPEKSQKRNRKLRQKLVIFILSQVLIGAVLYGNSSYLNSLGNPSLTYAGLALFLIGANLLLLRRLFVPQLKDDDCKEK